VLTIRSIVGLLAKTFSSADSVSVAEAERSLEDASQSTRFVDSLTFIMSDQEFRSTAL